MTGFNEGTLLVDGNTAAIGAVLAASPLPSWYPDYAIVQRRRIASAARPRCATDRRRRKPAYAIVQAGDELAAIGMVPGAGWAGARR